jgi:hypothetical protein
VRLLARLRGWKLIIAGYILLVVLYAMGAFVYQVLVEHTPEVSIELVDSSGSFTEGEYIVTIHNDEGDEMGLLCAVVALGDDGEVVAEESFAVRVVSGESFTRRDRLEPRSGSPLALVETIDASCDRVTTFES